MGKEHPIIFTVESVKAILDGRKTMTRRVVKDPRRPSRERDAFLSMSPGRPDIGDIGRDSELSKNIKPNYPCPYGQIRDRLWVREKYALKPQYDLLSATEVVELYGIRKDIYYETLIECFWTGRTRPSIFMPRWASRLTLEITGVRVERLQEISIEDIKCEGAYFDSDYAGANAIMNTLTPKLGFINLWDSINGKKYPWLSNPWVWVIKFDNIGVRA